MTGKVHFIGAGPGDPGLLTLKGLQCLQQADVILYDALAADELLRHARPGCRVRYVGKRGREKSLQQEELNQLIVEEARAGNAVARLKGGDPFIFGRGGEEAEYCFDHDVPFEIIPGVTAALGATAYSGIPLTHRDFTSTVALITGHEDPLKADSAVDWKALTRLGTLVFFMGVRNLPAIVKRLMEEGRDPKTPAAVIEWGTKPWQRTVHATLETLPEQVAGADIHSPALVVLGEVVGLREKLNWFETRPLFGRTIVITRAKHQAGELRSLLELQGARCLEFPTITIKPLAETPELDEALEELDRYDWLVLTSVNAWEIFLGRLEEQGRDLRALAGMKLAAVGPATAEAVEACHLKVDLVPDTFRAEAVLAAMKEEELAGKRILIPRAREARELLPEELRTAGARVDVAPVYETVCPDEDATEFIEMLREGQIDMVTFTSGSTARNFRKRVGEADYTRLMEGVRVAVISPVTGEIVEESGLKPGCVAREHTIPGLVRAILDFYGGPAA